MEEQTLGYCLVPKAERGIACQNEYTILFTKIISAGKRSRKINNYEICSIIFELIYVYITNI
jgi:hypothetical protein